MANFDDYFPMFKEFKTFSAIILIGWFSVAAAEPEEAAAQPTETATAEPIFVTLPEVMERVKSESPRVLLQNESVVRALERSFQQRAALLPQLSIGAQQTRQQFGQGFAGAAFDAPPFNSFDAQIQATQTLIDPVKYADYRLAKLTHAIAELDYEAALQDILAQAVQIYFTHLRDLRRVEIVEGNIIREQELLKLATDQYEAGVATKIDVTRAEVRVATERRTLMEASALVDDSILQLKELLNIDLEQILLLDGSIIDGIIAPPSLKKYASMQELTTVRPELVSQQRQLDQAILALRAASWQRLPTLELFGEWGYESSEAFDGDEQEAWLVGIRASIPLFEGGRIAAEKREARAAVRQNEYAMQDLKNRIEREFRFAMIDMDSRYAQIQIANIEVRLGLDEVELASERYREGLADNRELIDAQQRFSDAENSHLRAVYLYGLSRLAFARAIGAVEQVLE